MTAKTPQESLPLTTPADAMVKEEHAGRNGSMKVSNAKFCKENITAVQALCRHAESACQSALGTNCPILSCVVCTGTQRPLCGSAASAMTQAASIIAQDSCIRISKHLRCRVCTRRQYEALQHDFRWPPSTRHSTRRHTPAQLLQVLS